MTERLIPHRCDAPPPGASYRLGSNTRVWSERDAATRTPKATPRVGAVLKLWFSGFD